MVDATASKDATTVFIVDDDTLFAQSLVAMLWPMRLRTAQFTSAEDFLAAFDPEVPGCVLIDVRLPRISGLALLEHLRKQPLAPAVIVMTARAEVQTALRAMRQGAVDFLSKGFGGTELCEIVGRAIAEDAEKRSAIKRRQSIEARFARVTEPERQVLTRVLRGATNKGIAAELGISRRTVEDRKARVMQKLAVETLAELVRISMDAGVCAD